jgi:tetratricopeptide (TPR) repeat protein
MAKTMCMLAWMGLLFLSWPAGRDARLFGQEDASGAPCPAAKPKLLVAGRAAPSEKEYLALVAREKQNVARDMSAQGMRTLERTLVAAPRAAAGADLGLIFLSINDVSAAVYATAISAWRDPVDALTANNLGAALKVARAYDSAFSVLLYANARRHDSPVILTNLGNVAFALGDGKAAGEYYRQALAARADHPAALTGLGHLALCRGDKAGAERYFRKAMNQMYLPAARAGIEKTRSAGDSEPGNAKPGSAGAQPGAAQNKPISHPSGKGGGKGISLPDPPVSSSARGMALRVDDIARLAEDGRKQLDDLGQQIAAISSAMAGKAGAASSPSGSRIVLRNPNDKEAFVLDDTWRIFDARIWERTDRLLGRITDLMIRTQDRQMAILQQESAELAACGSNEACYRAAELKACRANHALAREAHAQFFPVWQELWQGTHTDLSDYHAFTTPWLQDIHDVQANRFYNITRQMVVLSQATSLYSLAQSEAQLMAQLTEGECTAFEEKREAWVPRPLKEWPDDPTKCRSGTMSMKLIIATLEGDCDKLSIEFGAGAFVSGEYRWGKTSAEDQVTLWGGLGQTVGAGPVSVSGKIGPYVTVQLGGDGSQLVDYGVKDEAGLSVQLGPARLDAAAEARLGAETGLNVDYSATPKLGAEI